MVDFNQEFVKLREISNSNLELKDKLREFDEMFDRVTQGFPSVADVVGVSSKYELGEI